MAAGPMIRLGRATHEPSAEDMEIPACRTAGGLIAEPGESNCFNRACRNLRRRRQKAMEPTPEAPLHADAERHTRYVRSPRRLGRPA